MNTYTLLVWEKVPEDTTFYLIPNEVADKHRGMFEMANGKFINSDRENEGMTFLNSALCENPEYGTGELASYECASPINAHITHVYISGFIL